MANGVRLAKVVSPNAGVPAPQSGVPVVLLTVSDMLGSTSVVIDKASGELVESRGYKAYGDEERDYRTSRWQNLREEYGFTGKEADVEVGLVYFGKRFLVPSLGRWLNVDPLALHSPGSADANLYAYVSGRVFSSVDPLGLDDSKSDKGDGKAIDISYLLPTGASPTAGYNPGWAPNVQIDEIHITGTAPLSIPDRETLWEEAKQKNWARDVRAHQAFMESRDGKLEMSKWSGISDGARSMLPVGGVASLLVDRYLKLDNVYTKANPDASREEQAAQADLVKHEESYSLLTRSLLEAVGFVATEAVAAVSEAVRAGTRGASTLNACSGQACFPGDTLVAVSGGFVAIQTVRVGDRVLAPNDDDSTIAPTAVDFVSWRVVVAELPDALTPGATYHVELLRSPQWLSCHFAAVGKTVTVNEGDSGAVGDALVTAILPAPPISTRPGHVVLTTVRHNEAALLQIAFKGSLELLRPTPTHRLYSADRHDWVAAGALQTGEHLRTHSGEVEIEAIQLQPTRETVFNFEVETLHAYLVGSTRILSHNSCCPDAPKLSSQAEKAVESLRARMIEHEQKLAAYRANPQAFDNRGDLARNVAKPEIVQQIIDRRVMHLEREISNFQSQIDKLLTGTVEP